MTVNFNPFPELKTARLTLRQLSHNDDAQMFVLRGDPQIMKYIHRPIAKTIADAAAVIDMINEKVNSNESINWAITLTGSDRLIGFIGYVRMAKENYRAEIGYLLHADFQGTGVMQEAVECIIAYGFKTLGLHSIEAVVSPENIASVKLLERNKFVREAYFKENEFYNGTFNDTAIYSLLA